MTTANPTSSHPAPSTLHSALFLARDIKLSHTVFALPFALFSAFIAADGFPHVGQILLILAAMVTARTAAMATNRLLDAPLDALNPRTQNRAIPAGRLSKPFVLTAIVTCILLFEAVTLAFYLLYHNIIPLLFGPFVLAVLCAYPLLKRFTTLCHYYLGAALALSPIGAYLAITPHPSSAPFVIAGGVLLWTAGFDILYACQDYHSDLTTGTFSIPAKLGIPRAFWVARLSHLLSAGLLFSLAYFVPALGAIYLAAVSLAALLLIVEHSIISPTDLSKLNLAFFTLNGCISLLLGTAGILDLFY